MIRAGLDGQVFFFLQAQIVVCSTIRLLFEHSIKNHPEAVSIIEKLTRFIGNVDWHKQIPFGLN